VATILLDRKFRLKRFTQATTKLLRVIDSDIGRPISDLAKSVIDNELLNDGQSVLENLMPVTKEVTDGEGRSYLRRIVPYRTDDNRIDGVVITFTDVTDRKERERVLQHYNEQLEKDVAERTALLDKQAREMAEITEQERQRLGRELHDSLSQQMTAIGVLADTLREQLSPRGPQTEVIDRLEGGIEEAKRQIRAVIKGLFPVDVEANGLGGALEDLAKETSSIFRVTCRFEGDGADSIHDNFTATQLYLIAREAVQNAARHSKAAEIVVRLREADGVRLVVEDDGHGLPQRAVETDGMGLRIMHYRSGLIRGKLKIESLEGHGTRITLQMWPEK
jgi:signal transduction histidine kinase